MTEMVITHSCTKDRHLTCASLTHVNTLNWIHCFKDNGHCKHNWIEISFICSQCHSDSTPRIRASTAFDSCDSFISIRLLYQVEMMKRFLELNSFKSNEIPNRAKDQSVRQQQPSVAWELRACDSDVQTKQPSFRTPRKFQLEKASVRNYADVQSR